MGIWNLELGIWIWEFGIKNLELRIWIVKCGYLESNPLLQNENEGLGMLKYISTPTIPYQSENERFMMKHAGKLTENLTLLPSSPFTLNKNAS